MNSAKTRVCVKMKGNKRALMGAIKQYTVQLHADVIELASKVYLDEVNREHKLSSIRKNITWVNEAHNTTCAFYPILSHTSEIITMEDDLTKVHDLKVAQEALLKAIQRKRGHFCCSAWPWNWHITAGSPVQLSSDEVEALVDAVKEEANMLCKDDFWITMPTALT